MPKALKLILIVVAVIIAIVAAILSYVLIAIDPNSYKPQLEQAAKDQGIELELKGDLGLSVFPYLAITIGETRFASEQHQLPPSSIQSTALALDLMALLQKKVAINALEIEGADLNFSSLEQTAAASAPAATGDQPTEVSGSNFSLAIDKVSILNSTLKIQAEDGSWQQISIDDFTSSDINTRGNRFPMSFDGGYADQDRNTAIPVSAKGRMGYNQSDDQLDLEQLSLSVAGIDISTNLIISGLQSSPAISGTLSAKTTSLKSALATLVGESVATQDPNVLQQLKLSGDIKVTDKVINLSNLSIQLDDTSLNGNMDFQLTTPRKLEASLSGTTINIDRYAAPENADTTPDDATTSGDAALLAPVLAPLVALDGGKGNIRFQMDSVQVAGITLDKPTLRLVASGQNLSLSEASFGLFNGSVTANASINASGAQPSVSFTQKAQGLDLAVAQQQLGQEAQLSGLLALNIAGTTKGETQNELMANLNSTGTLTISKPYIPAVNLEQSYCEMAALVEKSAARQQPWPEGTYLNDLNSQFVMQGNILNLTNYTTGVGNLGVSGNGTVDFDQQRFAVKVITNLQDEYTSENGCQVKSNRIRNKDIPLLCKDSFAKAGATSCKPDPEFLQQLLQKEIIDKFINKNGESDDKAKAVEGLLKGLFGK